MEVKESVFVFQADSDIVKKVYTESLNYLIEYDENNPEKEYCAVYFSSNDIYFPNEEAVFRNRIVRKNFFEWYNSRIRKAYKHIFVRDIIKQWYLSGINAEINSPERLLEFLKSACEGYKVITLGSSAGGYAAMLYGSQLNAERILAFNPQFEINSLLGRTCEEMNPLVFRLCDTKSRIYYDVLPFLKESSRIYYFCSMNSHWDIEQSAHSEVVLSIKRLLFRTSHHGIPFLKVALPKVLNQNSEQLDKYVGRLWNPILFTIKMVGIKKTVHGLLLQLYGVYKKRKLYSIQTILRFS